MGKLMFEKFNVLISCEGNAVPTVPALKRFANYAKSLGFTGMLLNMETMYHIEDEPYFGYMRGRYTKEEIRELEEYCNEKGITLMPCIQTLGHYYFLGKYATYNDYMDNLEVLLIDDERTYALIEKMFKTISEYFTTRYINIGMDEAFGMGLGKFLSRYGYQDRFDLMTRHLKRVLSIAEKYGFTCEMWSDMFINHVLTEEFLSKPKEEVREAVKDKMPQNVTISHWSYIDLDKEKLTRELHNHFKLTDNVSFTGALLKWFGFAPDNARTITSLKMNMKTAKECGVKSYNLGLWADWGGEASWFSILPSLFFASEYAHGNATCLEDLDKDKFKSLTGVDFDVFMLVDKPNKPHFDERYKEPNSKCVFYLYNDLLYEVFGGDFISENTGTDYQKSAKLLLEADGGEYGYILQTMGRLCAALALKTELGKKLKSAYERGDKTAIKRIADEIIPETIARVRVFFDAFEQQWRKENKPFGFETQCQRIGGLIYRMEYVTKRLQEYVDGKVADIPELQEKRLKPNVFRDNPTEDDYLMFGWNHIVANGWI